MRHRRLRVPTVRASHNSPTRPIPNGSHPSRSHIGICEESYARMSNSTASKETGFLTLGAGSFQRTTRATATGTARVVSISNCPVTRWHVMDFDNIDNDTLDGQSFSAGDELTISIMESKPDELLWKELGTLVTEQMHANLFVPSDAFAHFWTAAEATNGATYNIEIVLQRGPRDTLNAVSVGLSETIPSFPVRT